mmetsp:Transcript_15941/g.36774  ORF Transcript_15941/g.36774 Transcript_15941/m.36774 type:complete len:426 (+) Transcript_15941:161-1438(+)
MPRRSRSREPKKRRLPDGADDIFAEPSDKPTRDRPSRRPTERGPHQQRQRKRAPDTDDKEATKSQPSNQGGPNQRQRHQNRGRKQQQRYSSSGNIFADPNLPEHRGRDRRGGQSQRKHRHPDRKQSRKEQTNGRSQHSIEKNQAQTEEHRASQCVLDTMDLVNDGKIKVLVWDSPMECIPLWQEERMVEFMFKRNGKGERGMMKGKPAFLLTKYKKVLRELAPSGMNLPQVLSLRRHHIKLLNPSKSMTQLGLGTFDAIRESARIFEVAVEDFLKQCWIDYMTEDQQRQKARSDAVTLTVTPDFLLPKPVLLRKVRTKKHSGKSTVLPGERRIHWIEAKMYYGASTIPHGGSGAVGSVLAQAQKYVDHFGEGAFLFMMGCGEQLAADLNDIGVSVLDCSGSTVALDKVHDHQRTWCANEKGHILP